MAAVKGMVNCVDDDDDDRCSGCGKYRFNKKHFDTTAGGLPRLLDVSPSAPPSPITTIVLPSALQAGN